MRQGQIKTIPQDVLAATHVIIARTGAGGADTQTFDSPLGRIQATGGRVVAASHQMAEATSGPIKRYIDEKIGTKAPLFYRLLEADKILKAAGCTLD